MGENGIDVSHHNGVVSAILKLSMLKIKSGKISGISIREDYKNQVLSMGFLGISHVFNAQTFNFSTLR